MRRHCNLLLKQDVLRIAAATCVRRWTAPLALVGAVVAGFVFYHVWRSHNLREELQSWRAAAAKTEKLKDEIRVAQQETQRLESEVDRINTMAKGWSPSALLAAVVRATEATERKVVLSSLRVTDVPEEKRSASARSGDLAGHRKLVLRGRVADSYALARFAAALRSQPGLQDVVVDRVMGGDQGAEFVISVVF